MVGSQMQLKKVKPDIYDGNDLNSIYDKIIKFFNNDKYKLFGENALEFSKNFEWRKIVKQYIELI